MFYEHIEFLKQEAVFKWGMYSKVNIININLQL